MPGWQGWESRFFRYHKFSGINGINPDRGTCLGGSITVGIPQDIEDSLDPHKSVAAALFFFLVFVKTFLCTDGQITIFKCCMNFIFLKSWKIYNQFVSAENVMQVPAVVAFM